MPAIEVGRVCVKTAGRDAGKYCVITKLVDRNFVEITGPKSLSGISHQRANIQHLEATDKTVEIKSGAKDDIVEEAVKKVRMGERFKAGVKLSPENI